MSDKSESDGAFNMSLIEDDDDEEWKSKIKDFSKGI